MKKLSVLIVEDEVGFRNNFKSMLNDAPDFSDIHVAPNGKLGLEKFQQSRPNVIICTATLPDMSPAEFTCKIKDQSSDTGIIITSFPESPQSAENAVSALEKGAFDILIKPVHPIDSEGRAHFQSLALRKIRCFSIKYYSQRAQRLSRSDKAKGRKARVSTAHTVNPSKEYRSVSTSDKMPPYETVLVGASTGGPEALSVFIQSFPRSFPIPIVIVLHMPKAFTKPMAASLDKVSKLVVKESEHLEQILPGHAYLARGGIHLKLKNHGGRMRLQHSDTPPVNGCKPAVDVLFGSAAAECTRPQIAVILTGMGSDGTQGITQLHENKGNFLIVQDKASSLVWGMPGSAVKTGFIHKELPLDKIGPAIYDQMNKS